MGLTESGPILESVRFVKPANYEWRDTRQSVYRYTLLRVDMKVVLNMTSGFNKKQHTIKKNCIKCI